MVSSYVGENKEFERQYLGGVCDVACARRMEARQPAPPTWPRQASSSSSSHRRARLRNAYARAVLALRRSSPRPPTVRPDVPQTGSITALTPEAARMRACTQAPSSRPARPSSSTHPTARALVGARRWRRADCVPDRSRCSHHVAAEGDARVQRAPVRHGDRHHRGHRNRCALAPSSPPGRTLLCAGLPPVARGRRN
jgi:hypothetical protein